jgi:hypothetical protein
MTGFKIPYIVNGFSYRSEIFFNSEGEGTFNPLPSDLSIFRIDEIIFLKSSGYE